jgi:chromosome segregation ATPase
MATLGESKTNTNSPKVSSPLRQATDTSNTTIDSPGGPSSQTNKELLSSLQNRAQVFNQLWQAVEKVQGESISIATWKAKLKELEDAKSATKKLANELKNATGRNAELITHNAALMASREELNRELGLRDGRIEGLGAQLSQAREDMAENTSKHDMAIGKEQRARALTASELRDKIAENLSAQGHITELVSETQSLKTELLRAKEMSRINMEGLKADFKAAKDHVVALEEDKASISKHLWNVTDEIKKMAGRLDAAESLSAERLTHLEEARAHLTSLQETSAQTEAELTRDVTRLRNRNEELMEELSMLRRQKDQWEQDSDASTNALRSELEKLHVQLRVYEQERSGYKTRMDKAEQSVADIQQRSAVQVEEYKLKLSDERTAHRELRTKMEEQLNEGKAQVVALNAALQEMQDARNGQAVTLGELRTQLMKAKERGNGQHLSGGCGWGWALTSLVSSLFWLLLLWFCGFVVVIGAQCGNWKTVLKKVIWPWGRCVKNSNNI